MVKKTKTKPTELPTAIGTILRVVEVCPGDDVVADGL